MGLSVGLVSVLAAVGACVAIFLVPLPEYMIWLAAFIVFIGLLGAIVYMQWEQSLPNQWLLLIENGKLVKAGIGLKCFVWPTQTVVKFPSNIERIKFSARNVTKEMQGLEVEGFAIWSVNREEDGPFKCYKYTQGGDANENVKTMCESIVRNQIANSTLTDVLTNRNLLRDSMKKDLQKQLSGWGIWLETVEIVEVKICSKALFEDLQAEYRQDTRFKAEQIKQETFKKMEENKLSVDITVAKARNDTETKRLQNINEEQIKRETHKQQLFKQQCDLEIAKLQKEQELEMQKIEQQSVIAEAKKAKEMDAERLRKLFDLEIFEKTAEADGRMNAVALQKYIVDSTERIYSKLPLREINVSSYTGPENTSNIASLLPAIGMMQQAASNK